ncbi:MAG: pseudoazurin [Pseudomonadota bacterium]
MNRRSTIFALAAAALTAAFGGRALAERKVHTVEMITEPDGKFFVPDLLRVEVGDEVRFVNISGNHNTESVEGMIPEGAEPWVSDLNETFTLKITHEGVYGYKCTPHYLNGMVGVIVAGDASVNLDAAKAVEKPTRAANLFEILLGLAGK